MVPNPTNVVEPMLILRKSINHCPTECVSMKLGMIEQQSANFTGHAVFRLACPNPFKSGSF